MQSQLTPSESNLQPQNSNVQQGQSGLQQTGDVSTSDNSASVLSQQPPTNQLQVVQQGQPANAPPVTIEGGVPIGLWFLFAMSFAFIAIGLWLRHRSNRPTPPTVEPPQPVPEEKPEAPITKPAKAVKPNKKQTRKKRSKKR